MESQGCAAKALVTRRSQISENAYAAPGRPMFAQSHDSGSPSLQYNTQTTAICLLSLIVIFQVIEFMVKIWLFHCVRLLHCNCKWLTQLQYINLFCSLIIVGIDQYRKYIYFNTCLSRFFCFLSQQQSVPTFIAHNGNWAHLR